MIIILRFKFKVFDPSTKSHVSCAIFVNNVQRTLYVAPRSEAELEDEEGESKMQKVDFRKHFVPELTETRQKCNIVGSFK